MHFSEYQLFFEYTGWLSEICTHMTRGESRKPCHFWNKEKCLLESRKYRTKNEFRVGSNGAYGHARSKGWLHEFFDEFGKLRQSYNMSNSSMILNSMSDINSNGGNPVVVKLCYFPIFE